MYVFYDINLNEKNNIIIKNKKTENLTIITLYSINYINKNQYKTDLKLIKEHQKNNNIINSAIKINVIKLENSLSGSISQLKQQFNLVLGVAENIKISRFLLESTKIDAILNPQNEKLRDSTHNFNSGLNQVMVDIAKEREKIIFFSINSFMRKEKIDTRIIGKIQQNINILEKKKIKYVFVQIIKDFNKDKLLEINSIIPFFKIKDIKEINNQNHIIKYIN